MSYDQHPWEREDEEIRKAFAEKDAEIKRLKSEVGRLQNRIRRGVEDKQYKALITELADALRSLGFPSSSLLIQRAREAQY